MSENKNLEVSLEYPESNLKSYVPKGRGMDSFIDEDSISWKIQLWMKALLSEIVKRTNDTYKGLFVSESSYLFDRWKEELNIPDIVFPLSEDNLKDCYVKQHLIKGNTEWYFRAVANIYGAPCVVRSGKEYIREVGPIPEIRYANVDPTKVIVISIFGSGRPDFPLKFVHSFGVSTYAKKLQGIYEMMAPAHCYVVVREMVAEDFDSVEEFDTHMEEARENMIDLNGELQLWTNGGSNA